MPIFDDFPQKQEFLFTAQDYLESRKINFPLPKTLIMLPAANFSKELSAFSKKTYNLMGRIEIINDNLAVLHDFALGAPFCVFLAELCACLGAKEFVLAGTAGALAENLSFGDRVLCSGAYSQEGTSRHYISAPYIAAQEIERLKSLSVKAEGDTLTTDAFFRERKSLVADYTRKGCLTAEMEAAALFAFAAEKGLKAGAVFVISDLLYGGHWRPAQKNAQIIKTLRVLVQDLIKLF